MTHPTIKRIADSPIKLVQAVFDDQPWDFIRHEKGNDLPRYQIRSANGSTQFYVDTQFEAQSIIEMARRLSTPPPRATDAVGGNKAEKAARDAEQLCRPRATEGGTWEKRLEFDEAHMWTLRQAGSTGLDRSPGDPAQDWAYDYIMQLQRQLSTLQTESASWRDSFSNSIEKAHSEASDLKAQLTLSQSREAELVKERDEAKQAADLWKKHYRTTYGHPWENRNSNHQGL